MPGLNNSESRQVTHDSQGLRVTVRIADDSTSNSNINNNNNNNNAADDSTSDLTNFINNSDDLTSNINSDDFTSVTPTVVPIGRARRLARPNNVSNPSPVGHGVGRGGACPQHLKYFECRAWCWSRSTNSKKSSTIYFCSKDWAGGWRRSWQGWKIFFTLTVVQQLKLRPLP